MIVNIGFILEFLCMIEGCGINNTVPAKLHQEDTQAYDSSHCYGGKTLNPHLQTTALHCVVPVYYNIELYCNKQGGVQHCSK